MGAKIVRTVLVLVALAAAGWAVKVWWLTPDPVAVTVVAVEKGRVEETATNSRAGTVEARRRAQLSPEIGGRVAELPHRQGERVRRGETVLRLSAELQRAQLRVSERRLEATRAEQERACLASELAQREVERNLPLAREEIIAADLLDRLENQAATTAAACRAAGSAVEQARAEEALTRAELDKTVLRSPFDGVVAELSIEVGEWTTPSPPGLPIPPVLDILDPGTIYVSAPMDEVDSARIAAGQPVRVTVDSHPGRSFPGRVARVAPYVLDIEQQNRTVEIEVELDDADFAARLLPGTSADVEVILDARDGALRLPTQALLDGERALVAEDGVLVEKEVEVGLRNWDFTEIRGGLSEGERVVTSLDRVGVEVGALVEIEGDGKVSSGAPEGPPEAPE